jgi:pentafunctional AROM polypeptide
VDEIRAKIRADDFGGASVTIPLKLDVMPLLDEVDPAAQLIGAVNTIVPVADPRSGKTNLVGRNTDYLGMIDCLRAAGASTALGEGQQSGLVIGGGGTARAAVQTLHTMGYKPIYLIGRNSGKLVDLAATFPPSYDLVVLDPAAASLESSPTVAIATIPANIPIDPTLGKALTSLFSSTGASQSGAAGQGSTTPARILLELAYKPAHTAVMQMAETAGQWKTVQGLEMLVSQGEWQFEYWTGIRVRGLAREMTRVSSSTRTCSCLPYRRTRSSYIGVSRAACPLPLLTGSSVTDSTFFSSLQEVVLGPGA